MWQFFHKLGSPKWFYGIAGRFMPWLLAIGLLLTLAGIIWGLGSLLPSVTRPTAIASSISMCLRRSLPSPST